MISIVNPWFTMIFMELIMEDSFMDTTDCSGYPPFLENQMEQTMEPLFVPKKPSSNLPPKEKLQTDVYYHLDDQKIMYKATVNVPPNRFNLSHLMLHLNRTNIQGYVMEMDYNVNSEVRRVVTPDEIIKPGEDNLYKLYLMTVDENHGTLQRRKNKEVVPTVKPFGNSQKPNLPKGRQSINRRHVPHQKQQVISKYPEYSESSSEDDSCNFTSISQQVSPNPYQRRRKRTGRGRRAYSPSFMSTTMETDMSVKINTITVTLNLDSKLPFGISVVWRENGPHKMLTVSKIAPGSLVARDGRIKEDWIILEVNDRSLDEIDENNVVQFLQKSVNDATKRRGELKLTLCEPTLGSFPFRLPEESVHPIDTEDWIQTTNKARGFINKDIHIQTTNGYHRNTYHPSSGVGSSIVSSDHHNKRFNFMTPLENIVQAMVEYPHGVARHSVMKDSLNIRDGLRGQDIINWLSDNIYGIDDNDSACIFVEKLRENGLLVHINSDGPFCREDYYTVNFDRLPRSHQNTLRRGDLKPWNNKPSIDDSIVTMKKVGCFKAMFCGSKSRKK